MSQRVHDNIADTLVVLFILYIVGALAVGFKP